MSSPTVKRQRRAENTSSSTNVIRDDVMITQAHFHDVIDGKRSPRAIANMTSLLGCDGILCEIADGVMDCDMGNWIQVSRAMKTALQSTQKIWWTRFRRQLEYWTSEWQRRLERRMATISTWRPISDAKKIKARQAENAKTADDMQLAAANWALVLRNWQQLGAAPENDPWHLQYRRLITSAMRTSIQYGVVNCTTGEFECWLPFSKWYDHAMWATNGPPIKTWIVKRLERANKSRMRYYCTQDYRSRPIMMLYSNPGKRFHHDDLRSQDLLESQLVDHDLLEHLRKMHGEAMRGAAFCVHAVLVYGTNLGAGVRQILLDHTRSLSATGNVVPGHSNREDNGFSVRGGGGGGGGYRRLYGGEKREHKILTRGDIPRLAAYSTTEQQKWPLRTCLCSKRGTALFPQGLYSSSSTYWFSYKKPKTPPQHPDPSLHVTLAHGAETKEIKEVRQELQRTKTSEVVDPISEAGPRAQTTQRTKRRKWTLTDSVGIEVRRPNGSVEFTHAYGTCLSWKDITKPVGSSIAPTREDDADAFRTLDSWFKAIRRMISIGGIDTLDRNYPYLHIFSNPLVPIFLSGCKYSDLDIDPSGSTKRLLHTPSKPASSTSVPRLVSPFSRKTLRIRCFRCGSLRGVQTSGLPAENMCVDCRRSLEPLVPWGPPVTTTAAADVDATDRPDGGVLPVAMQGWCLSLSDEEHACLGACWSNSIVAPIRNTKHPHYGAFVTHHSIS